MATIPGSAALYSAQRQFIREMNNEMLAVVGRIQALIISSAAQVVERDGQRVHIIPPENERRLITAAGDELERFYVGADFRHAFAPDGVSPLSPYARLLNKWLVLPQWAVVRSNARFLRRRLKNHPDILRWLASRRPSAEQESRSNPLAAYSPAHTWVDPNGYRLSDRIWRAGFDARVRLDAMLRDAIEQGTGALELSKQLEQFLLPEAKGLTTTRPYGKRANYHALRLARTEISRAHSYATYAAGLGNPYVTGMDWALSIMHPKFDVCDRLATIGMNGERLRDPYPITSNPPIVVQSSHPQCICTNRLASGISTQQLVDYFRGMIETGAPPPVTVVGGYEFFVALVGFLLAQLVPPEERELEEAA